MDIALLTESLWNAIRPWAEVPQADQRWVAVDDQGPVAFAAVLRTEAVLVCAVLQSNPERSRPAQAAAKAFLATYIAGVATAEGKTVLVICQPGEAKPLTRVGYTTSQAELAVYIPGRAIEQDSKPATKKRARKKRATKKLGKSDVSSEDRQESDDDLRDEPHHDDSQEAS